MNNNIEYKQCVRCLMDTTATGIKFNENGECNFCVDFENLAHNTIWRPLDLRLNELNAGVNKIKLIGEKSKYDCLIGLSGGVDSSYICYWAKQQGLRPLVVHFDNGWNSELASQNIEKIINKTGFDLFTYVINWEDFRDLQLSYIKASVIDIEVPTDQLIFATLFKIARKFKIKSVINGNNISSEGILPRSWYYPDKLDIVNLINIHKQFGSRPLKNFPKLGLVQQFINSKLYSMFSISPLNLLDYDTEKAKQLLIHEYDWKDYGGKHYESIFTRFYQGYILPSKFNVDKRKAHLSSLVMSKIITRKQAADILEKPTYNFELQQNDYEYALKKFGISKDLFEEYMKRKPVAHSFYGTQWDKKEFRKYFIFKKIFGPFFNLIQIIKRK